MKEITYKQWLTKKIGSVKKSCFTAQMNYQETGAKNFYTASKNKENELRALYDSVGIEDGIDKHREVWRKTIASVIDLAENAALLLLPEEALKGIIEELYKLKWM